MLVVDTPEAAAEAIRVYAYAMRIKKVRDGISLRIAYLKKNPSELTQGDLDAFNGADGRKLWDLFKKHPEIKRRFEEHQDTAEEINSSLHEFMRRAYAYTRRPGEFQDGWHLRALCREYEDIYYGRTPRLIVCQPPGTMKSMITNIFFVAWAWTLNPEYRYIQYAYNNDPPKLDGEALLALVTSPWYRRNFPHVKIVQESSDRISTSAGGWRMGLGVNGTATGLHPHHITVDDPSKAGDVANRPNELVKVIRWFASTISSRGMVTKCSVAIVMQRLATNDLVGAILRESEFGGDEESVAVSEESRKHVEDWRVVCLPMFFNPTHRYLYEFDERTEPGELLWPDVIDEETVRARIRMMELDPELGGKTTAAQIDQDPLSVEGAIFQCIPESFIQHRDLPAKIRHGRFVRAVDFAASQDGGDYTTAVLLVEYDDIIYIVDAVRFRKEAVDRNHTLVEIAKKDSEKFLSYRMAAEQSQGFGKEVFQTLAHKLARAGIQAMAMPTGSKSKTHRAEPLAGAIKHGEVRILQGMSDFNVFVRELTLFPGGKHDDYVDAASHGYTALRHWREGKI